MLKGNEHFGVTVRTLKTFLLACKGIQYSPALQYKIENHSKLKTESS